MIHVDRLTVRLPSAFGPIAAELARRLPHTLAREELPPADVSIGRVTIEPISPTSGMTSHQLADLCARHIGDAIRKEPS